jgi:hypothetical protein
MDFDRREVEAFLKASRLTPRDELKYRLALSGISARCRNTARTHELLVGLSTDELARIIVEARTFEAELRGG